MCDEANRIMRLVDAARRVEVFTAQKITKPQLQVITIAEKDNCEFEIEGRRFKL